MLASPTFRQKILLSALIIATALFYLYTRTKTACTATCRPFERLDTGQVCEEARITPSSVYRGIPGFLVFDNLRYHDGAFYFLGSPVTDLSKENVVSGLTEFNVVPWKEKNNFTNGISEICLTGSALFLNDGHIPGVWSYFTWYYHFVAEVLLGGLAIFSEQTVPRWLIIPWGEEWHEGSGMNDLVAKGIWGDGIVDAIRWKNRTGDGEWIVFDRVVIVDRTISHKHNPIANKWNKMALPAFNHPHAADFFSPAREAFLQSLSIPLPPPRRYPGATIRRIPKIVYIDRSGSNRKIKEADRKALITYFKQLEDQHKAKVFQARFEDLPGRDQVQALSDADILISVHGNGMTQQLWMPPGGTVIELFVPNSFLRDYQIVAEVLGHEHIAVWNDTIYPRSEWELHPGEMNPGLLHDGTKIPLDNGFIRGLVGDVIHRMTTTRMT